MKITYNFIFSEVGIALSENMLLQSEDMGNNETRTTMEATREHQIEKKNTKTRKHQIATSVCAF